MVQLDEDIDGTVFAYLVFQRQPTLRKKVNEMVMIDEGQCGVCVHFGKDENDDKEQLVQIRTSRQAPQDLVEPCSHPKNRITGLKVTPISSCSGFEPANN